MKRSRSSPIPPLLAALFLSATAEFVVAQQPVRSVLFFSPTCPHCGEVIRNHLPIFFQVYGGPPQLLVDEAVSEPERFLYLFSNGQLEVLLVDASRPSGGLLYAASMESHRNTLRPSGVPRLIFGDSVLVGADEIPQRLHGFIQDGLAGGGVDWPNIEGLRDAMVGLPHHAMLVAPEAPTDSLAAESTPEATTDAPSTTPVPAETTDSSAVAPGVFEAIPEGPPTMLENFRRDPMGNGLSVVVLAGMLASVLVLPLVIRPRSDTRPLSVAVPLVGLLGAAVASYLTYIEATGSSAVCGPVGDCNAVQQSPYATLFGIVPIGALGLVAYVAIVIAWIVSRVSNSLAADWATLVITVVSIVGTLFSIYLTFLEPFVIGATCAWCLTSAVAITALLWLSAPSGVHAWLRLTHTHQ